MYKKLLVTTLMSAAMLASADACTAKAADTSPAPGAITASSANPSPAVAPSHPAQPDLEISNTPFKKATADQVVQAWTAKWHPQFRVIQTPLVHTHLAVVDNPFGSGTLQLYVSQRGTGKAPGAVQLGFDLEDPSAKGYLKVTPKEMTTLFRACFSPALSETQIKQTSSWISSTYAPVWRANLITSDNPNRATGAGHDFPGLRMRFVNFNGEFSVDLLSR